MRKRAKRGSYKNDARFYYGMGVCEMVPCKCPCCGREHLKKMYWTGTLPARVYCYNCERRILKRERLSEIESQPYLHGKLMVDEELEGFLF